MTKKEQLLVKENEELKNEIRELRETLEAISAGEVDAIVVSKDDEKKIFTLENTDLPYRILIENIKEGALTLASDGMILYSNAAFSSMRQLPLSKIIGTNIVSHISSSDRDCFDGLLCRALTEPVREEMNICSERGMFPVLVSLTALHFDGSTKISAVVSDRRKDYENLLLQSRMLDSVADAVIAADPSGKIIYWNEAASKTYGWKRDEAIGRDFISVTASEMAEEDATNIFEKLKQGEIWSGQYIVKHRDGHLFSIDARDSPVFDDDGNLIAILGASHDISERKQAEEELRRAHTHTALILESISDSFISLDSEWRFIFANKRALEYSGKTFKETIGKSIWKVFPALIGTPLEAFYRKAMVSQEPLIFINQSAIATDKQFELHAYPMESGLSVFGQDITERKRAEEVLRENEQRLNLSLEASQLGTWDMDLVRHTARRSLRHDQIFGYQELLPEWTYEIFLTYVIPEDREQVDKKFHDAIENKEDWNFECRILSKDSILRWISARGKGEYDTDGKPVRMIGIVQDITERKLAEEMLQERESIFRSFFDSPGVMRGIVEMIEEDDVRHILDNTLAATFIGQTPENMKNKTSSELGEPRDILHIWAQNYLESQKTGKPVTFEYRDTRGIIESWMQVTVSYLGTPKRYPRFTYVAFDITWRKMSELALHLAQERTATILEGIADTFYSLDNQWRFTTVNPAAEKAPFGLPASDLLGKVIWELYPAIVGTRIHQHYLDAAKNQSMEHYVAVSPLNGRWYEVFMQGREAGVDVYMRDVTERKQAEEVLRESEEKYRGLFENVQESVAIYRMVYNENGEVVDRIFVDANPKALYEMGNLKREDVIGKSYAEIVSREFPKDRASIDNHLQNLAAVVQSGIPVSYETHFGDKHYLTTQYLVNKDLVASSSIEITERKNAERALHESENKYRELVENANSIIIRMDKEGKISFFNEFAQKFFGYSPDEVLGQHVKIIVPPVESHGRNLEEMMKNILQNPDNFSENENENIKKNGERVWISWRNKAILDNQGKFIGNLAIGQDITDRKRVEEALLDNEKRLREADKLLEAVTEATKVIIAVEDTNFRYTYFNKPYASTIRSLTGKELTLGMSMIDVFSEQPEEQRSELNEWGRVMNGESVNQRIIFGNPSAGHTVYNVLHVPLRDESGTIIGAGEVAFDVTEKILVEETLRETSQYLTNLIDYANAPIIVWDSDFLITRFNHAFEYLTGRKAKNVIGQHLNILLPEVYQEEAMDLIRKTSVGERWESVEIPILHKNGTVRTVLWNSASIFGADGETIVSVIAQGQDITDRKESERVLRETLALLNAALESMDEGICVVDLNRKITSKNQNFIILWNVPVALITKKDDRKVEEFLSSMVKDPAGFLKSTNELYKHPERESFDMMELRDGRIFERHSKPQRIKDDIIGRIWSYRDITDRRRAEENLVASLHEKEVLLREIHHRVKNNLQLISGLLDMTRMRTRDEATNLILADMMLKIQTMAQIHTRLYESKQFGKISLTGQFRDQAVNLSNIYSRKGHEITCEITSGEVFLPVDQAIPCALVVNEILSNAYKHAFKGKKHGTIEISAMQKDGWIRIAVRDDGIGMPANFDISSANSLGIKLVRTLVQHQLKGSITINSGDGTEMIIEFPLTTAGE